MSIDESQQTRMAKNHFFQIFAALFSIATHAVVGDCYRHDFCVPRSAREAEKFEKRSAAGREKRLQMETTLLRNITQFGCHRTGVARETASRMTLGRGRLQQIIGAGIHSVSLAIECVYRAALQARPGNTIDAG